jgi:hypothetical protein
MRGTDQRAARRAACADLSSGTLACSPRLATGKGMGAMASGRRVMAMYMATRRASTMVGQCTMGLLLRRRHAETALLQTTIERTTAAGVQRLTVQAT